MHTCLGEVASMDARKNIEGERQKSQSFGVKASNPISTERRESKEQARKQSSL